MDVCSEKVAPPIPARRRASELPSNVTQAGKAAVCKAAAATGKTAAAQSSGIVCTNTDLMSIMNSLKSSASKALQSSGGRPGSSKTTDSLPAKATASVAGDRRRDTLRSGRSNSVDVANLGATAAMAAAAAAGNSTRNWFRKMSTRSTAAVVTAMTGGARADAECPEQQQQQQQHQRAATVGGEYVVQKSPVVVTFADERPKVSLLEPVVCKPDRQVAQPAPPPVPAPVSVPAAPTAVTAAAVLTDEKPVTACDDVVVWDRPTGSVVNAEVLGTAIEGFLAAKKTGDSNDVTPADDEQQQSAAGNKPPVQAKTANESNNRTCDTSICSSLKDLFVK